MEVHIPSFPLKCTAVGLVKYLKGKSAKTMRLNYMITPIVFLL